MNYQINKLEKTLILFQRKRVDMSDKEDGSQMSEPNRAAVAAPATAKVYCPMCTHTVDAEVEQHARHLRVKRGQKCPRCSAALDAGYIMYLDRAA